MYRTPLPSLSFPLRGISMNAAATHGTHSNCTPGGVPAGGSTHADTINHVHTRTACFADLRDHAVWLMKGSERCGLGGCCDRQGKGDSPPNPVSHCRSTFATISGPLSDRR